MIGLTSYTMPSDRENLVYRRAVHRAFYRGSPTGAADVRDGWERQIIRERGALPDGWQNRMAAVFGAYGKIAVAVAGEADPAEMMDATQARNRAWNRLLEVEGEPTASGEAERVGT